MTIQLPAVELVYVARDERGRRATPAISLVWTDFSTATARAVAVLGRVQALSTATIESFNLNYRFHVTDDPAPTSELNNDVGIFIFECSVEGQFLYLEIPGIRPEYIETEAPYIKINTTAPAISALVANIISSDFCNPFGYSATALLDAYVSFQP